jgi:hypothetical protein
MKKLILIIIALIVVGCGSSKPPVVEKKEVKIASWYISPPNNDNIYLYGVAEGTNMQKATQNALENLSSRLSVTISSQIEDTTTSKREYSNYLKKSTTKVSKSETKELTLNNYKIQNSQKVAYNRYLVMVSIKKSEIIKSIKDKISQIDINIDTELKHISTDVISQIVKYTKVLNILNQNISKADILSRLDSSYDIGKYYQRVANISKEIAQLKNSISFYIEYDHNSESLIEIIKNELSKYEYNISDTKNSDSILLKVSTNLTQKRAYDFKIVEADMSIRVSSNSISLGGSSIRFKSASTTSFYNATVKLKESLRKYIKENKIVSIVGSKLENIMKK